MILAPANGSHSTEKKAQTQISTVPLVSSFLLVSKVHRGMKNEAGLLHSDTSRDAS